MEELRKMEEEKNNLRSLLREWGTDLERMKEEAKEYTLTQADIVLLQQDKVSLMEQVTILKSELQIKESEKKSLEDDISGLKQTQEIESKMLEQIQNVRLDQEDTCMKVSEEIEQKTVYSDQLDKDIASKESYKDSLDKEISAAEEKVKDLLADENDIHDTLLDLRKEEIDLKEANKVLDSQLDTKHDELGQVEVTISEKKSLLTDLDDEYVVKREMKEQQLIHMEVPLRARESELAEREGALSLKESSLEKKEDMLRDYKTQIERHLGKPTGITI